MPRIAMHLLSFGFFLIIACGCRTGTGGAPPQAGVVYSPPVIVMGTEDQANQPAGANVTSSPIQRPSPEPLPVTVLQVKTNVGKLLGQTVVLTAPVDEVYSQFILGLEDADILVGHNLLVITRGMDRLPVEGEYLTITGEVRTYIVPDIERDYEWFEPRWLDSVGETDVSGRRPVIVASSVRTRAGKEILPIRSDDTNEDGVGGGPGITEGAERPQHSP